MGLFSKELAIDLGTANTVVYVRGRGVVVREPTIIALDHNKRVVAVGNEAKSMAGRTPFEIDVVRPIKDGVINDFETTEALLDYFISKAGGKRGIFRPIVLIGVPSGVTPVEKKAVIDAAIHVGARQAYVIPEPLAAAIGAGLPIEEARGSMIVDIGGGTTEVAVISLKGIVVGKSTRIAGDEMNEAIINYIRRQYSILIGDVTAEQIKMRIGSAFPLDKDEKMEIRGRDLIDGLPKSITITSEEIRKALQPILEEILNVIKSTLEITPPELASDVMDRGIMLSGGGALLKNIDKFLTHRTGILFTVAEDPLSSVALGAGKVIENFDYYKDAISS
ncbi:rod shape-determining protein [Caldisericum exile]|uniref:Cell shape-determining protein MreB n=1 Tax=Caldisericum exile (strain DSM 21853 / NBRC 104410 / AZM16c01) TaxID=511051 RepID=A0A7U6GEU4_CALEA|nr:rod shape-determining protein [Caldisericum exile]BAL81076.1 rod shape-determining protein MreB [Caldisericum exile AZM16c01]